MAMVPSGSTGLVLVTGAASRLGVAVTAQLIAQGSAVRTTDTVDIEVPGEVEHWVCNLGHDASTTALLAGVGQIIHLEPISEHVVPSLERLAEQGGDDDDQWLDRCTRCTYNLLDAAARAEVEHFVLGSTMDQFLAVDSTLVLDTSWRPRPGCEPHVLGPHLAEIVAKEYAAVGAMQRVTIARIGQILPDLTGPPTNTQSTASIATVADSRFWIGVRDAASELAEVVDEDDKSQPAPELHFYIGGGHASQLHPHHRRITILHIASDAPRPGVNSDLADDNDCAIEPAELVTQRAALVKAAWKPQAAQLAASPKPLESSPIGGRAIIVLGADGLMGPQVVHHLRHESVNATWTEVRATDAVQPADADQKSRREIRQRSATSPSFVAVDVSDKRAVWSAVNGAEALVNCAVSRHGRFSPWEVNCKGVYNSLTAAVSAGMRRYINTGPHWALFGPEEALAINFIGGHGSLRNGQGIIDEDWPLSPGTTIYPLSKAIGLAICRAFAGSYPITVISHLYHNVGLRPDPVDPGEGITPLAVTFADAARAIEASLRVPLHPEHGAAGERGLPSRYEVFFISADLPHGKYSTAKAKELLGWTPRDKLEGYWRRPAGRSRGRL